MRSIRHRVLSIQRGVATPIGVYAHEGFTAFMRKSTAGTSTVQYKDGDYALPER